MAADKDLPKRFAKIVIAELADIHAHLQCLEGWMIGDISDKTRASREDIAKKFMEQRRAVSKDLHKRLSALLSLDS